MKFLRSLIFAAVALASLTPLAATDLSITTTSFLPSAKAKRAQGAIAGATMTIGQLLYLDDATQTWKLADANASAATSVVLAIAGSAAVSGQPCVVITYDPELTLGATLSMSAPVYVLSATAGGIAPVADLTTGMYPVPVIVATSTTKCLFNPTAMRGSAVAVAP